MNEPNDEARDKLTEILKDSAARLSEHFENVQIFASNFEQGGEFTSTYQTGTGNWCARHGQVREWMVIQNERMRCRARKDDNEDES